MLITLNKHYLGDYPSLDVSFPLERFVFLALVLILLNCMLAGGSLCFLLFSSIIFLMSFDALLVLFTVFECLEHVRHLEL